MRGKTLKVSVGSPEGAVALYEELARNATESAQSYADPEVEKTHRITQRERLKQLHEARGKADAYAHAADVLRNTLDRASQR